MMHSYSLRIGKCAGKCAQVLILVIMDDALVHCDVEDVHKTAINAVLILVVMDDALAPADKEPELKE